MEKEFDKTFMLNELKIKHNDFLNDLFKEELLYIHLFTLGKYDCEEMASLAERCIDYNEFTKILKKGFKLKKVNREFVINDLINFACKEENIEQEIFDFTVFKDPTASIINKEYYISIFSLIMHKCDEELKDMDNEEVVKYIESLVAVKDRTRLNYNIVKIIYLTNNITNYISISELTESTFKNLSIALFNNYILLNNDNIKIINKLNHEMEKKSSYYSIQLEKKNTQLKQLREDNKLLNKKIKELSDKKETVNVDNTLKDINYILKKQQEYNTEMIKEIKSFKVDASKSAYESEIDRLNSQISDLKMMLKDKSTENKEIKKQVELFENNIIDKFKLFVEENGINEELRKFLFGKLDEKYYEENQEEKMTMELLDQTMPTYVREVNEYIGYVTIEDNVHYLNLIDGKKQEILDIPEKVYLSENQFVLCNSEFKFVYSYQSKYEDNGISISNLTLAPITSEIPLQARICERIRNVSLLHDYNKPKVNQIVGIDSNFNIVRMFKFIRNNADSLMKSIQSKGQKAYYVLKIMPSGIYVRDIDSDIEDILKINVEGFDLKEKCVICVKNDTIINLFNSGRFYTTSSYYSDRLEYAVIEIKDNNVFGKKISTDELIKIDSIPFDCILSDGQVVAIDEFNSFLFLKSTEDYLLEKNIYKKPIKSNTINKPKDSVIDIRGSVTIIGNTAYESTYKLAFLKYGFKANVIYGFEKSLTRILQACKDSDYIIGITNHMSHDNMWKIKESNNKIGDKTVIFSTSDGANRLVSMVLEHSENKKEVTA